MNVPRTPQSPRNIILIGFMGSGKSSVGRTLARRLDWQFLDTDGMIEDEQGESIARIFETRGEAAFRELESRVANELGSRERCVIATGGGFPVPPENREAASRAGVLVFLIASSEAIWHRVGRSRPGRVRRPLLAVENPRQRIEQLLAERLPAYEQADLKIETDGKSQEAIAEEIAEELFAQTDTGGTKP